MNPSVIVATVIDDALRVYVGNPANGGMQQCAQLSTTRAIDPHDLADMAVSMAAQFGWVIASATEPPKQLRAVPSPKPTKPVKSEKRGKPHGGKSQQLVQCPECPKRMVRQNLRTHLISAHKWPRDAANRAVREAPAIYATAADIPAALPAAPKSTHARGIAGQRHLEANIFPKVLELVKVRDQVSSADVARHMGVAQHTAAAWLAKMTKRGTLVKVAAPANGPHTYELAHGPSGD